MKLNDVGVLIVSILVKLDVRDLPGHWNDVWLAMVLVKITVHIHNSKLGFA